MRLQETTAATLQEAAVNQNGRVLLRLIAPGWSQNGRYYPESVLRRDGLRVFREGLHTYLNHPSRTEREDRPERDVRDLVGGLSENSYYDPNGPVGPGVYAHADVRQDYRPIVDDLAQFIGMSIVAEGTGHHGEAEGRQGLIIDSLESARSVDYVTDPAAGGRVVELIESVQNPTREPVPAEPAPEPVPDTDESRQQAIAEAVSQLREARNAADWIEVEIHRGVLGLVNHMWEHGRLTREEWQAVNAATTEAMNGFRASLTRAMPDLLTRDPLAPVGTGPASMSEATQPDTDPPAEPVTESGGDPAPEDPPADQEAGTNADPSAPTPVQEATSREGEMTGTPGAGTAPTPLSAFRQQVSTELANERRRAAMAEARERTRSILSGRFVEEAITPAQQHRITESVLRDLPMVEQDGQLALDEATLLTRVQEQIDQATLEITEALSAAGYGRPRDVGPSAFEEAYAGTNQAHEDQMKQSFIRLGLSESAAERAAKGR